MLTGRAMSDGGGGPRDDLFAVMPPLEAKKALFAYVAGVREKTQEHARTKCNS